MFPKERRRAMAAYIDAEGHATVEELAQRFSVSVDSIRKDLKVLAAEGLCRREYGGATRIDRPEPEPASEAALLHGALDLAEEDSAEHSRRAVAARAYMEIADGDAIFLDVSKTCLYIAELLAAGDKRCIVTTNMIDIPTVLAKNPKVTALATGGYLFSANCPPSPLPFPPASHHNPAYQTRIVFFWPVIPHFPLPSSIPSFISAYAFFHPISRHISSLCASRNRSENGTAIFP